MFGHNNNSGGGGRKQIESEMDRFEKEISSLGPLTSMSRSFIPAQLRRPGTGHLIHPSSSSSGAHPPPQQPPLPIVKPSPIIISGAPQVYGESSSTTAVTPVSSFLSTMVRKPHHPTPTPLSSSSVAAPPPPVSIAPVNANFPSSSSTGGGGGPMLSSGGGSGTGGTIVKLLENPKSSSGSILAEKKKKKKKKDDKDKKPRKQLRSAGGQIWEDVSLHDWDPNDFRLFCGDLGNDVTDEVLTRVFGRYPSFQKARVIRDRRTNKTKGFGFVSFKDPNDFVRAIKELDGRYVGSRPIKLRKSNWRNRNLEEARKKDKERAQLLALVKK